MLVLFITLLAYAAPLEITREGARVFLQTSSCERAGSIVTQLERWTKSLHEQASCQKPGEGEGACKVDITQCLPKHARENIAHVGVVGGANCWNSALTAKGILPALRYVEFDEWNHYLQPPLCRELDAKEPPQAGDLAAIRGNGIVNEDVHGFIYISPSWAYNKHDGGPMTPYEILPVREILNGYAVPQGGAYLKNYRCLSMKEFFATADLEKEIRERWEQANRMDKCVARLEREPIAPEIKDTIEQTVRSLAFYVKKEEKKATGENKAFLLGALKFRVHALAHQVFYHGESEFQDRLAELVRTIGMDAN